MREEQEIVHGNAADFRQRFGAGYWPLAETTFPNSPLGYGIVLVRTTTDPLIRILLDLRDESGAERG